MKTLVSASKLSYTINGRTIVRDLDISLHTGELVGLIGPNGAGKSTVLKLLLGLIKPSTGTVLYEQKPLTILSDKQRAQSLAWCAQEHNLSLTCTVDQILEMGRYPHLGRWDSLTMHDKQILRQVKSFVGLDDWTNADVSTLSAGERQILMFARALVQDTQCLLLDEPSSNLDMGTEHKLFAMITELRREGKGIVAAIHNLNTAAEYCDRLILMYQGSLVAEGTPAKVLSEENLRRYYGIEVKVQLNQVTGSTSIVHIPKHVKNQGKRVHLIGGAGSALALTRLLVQAGYQLSAGVAHEYDSDAQLWHNLQIEMVKVAAFSHIDDSSFAQAHTLMAQADWVVLCAFPIGPSNRRNLVLAAQARRLLIVEEEPGFERFFGDQAIKNQFDTLAHKSPVLTKNAVLAHLAQND